MAADETTVTIPVSDVERISRRIGLLEGVLTMSALLLRCEDYTERREGADRIEALLNEEVDPDVR